MKSKRAETIMQPVIIFAELSIWFENSGCCWSYF